MKSQLSVFAVDDYGLRSCHNLCAGCDCTLEIDWGGSIKHYLGLGPPDQPGSVGRAISKRKWNIWINIKLLYFISVLSDFTFMSLIYFNLISEYGKI